MAEQFDVTVIGSGPGGYVCAIKCAQLGLKTAIIEKMPTLGGTCLNIGCIPSKALLHASERFHEASHGFDALGIEVGKPKLDLKKMMAHKDAVVKSNVDGVDYLMKKNKITVFHGTGKVAGAGKVTVSGDNGEQTVETKNIVIATGSAVAGIPGVEVAFDDKVVVSSTEALELTKVPKSMTIVGGGVIGLELGSVWSRLGAKVTVVEYLGTILGGMDDGVSKQFQKILKKQGVDFHLNSKVTGVEKKGAKGVVTFEPVAGGDTQTLESDVVLVATGRRPYTDGLGLEDAGVVMERGKVKTDAHWRTNVGGIYAIGDVIDGPMLAHKAEDEGVAVAETIAGQHGHVNYNVIPSVVYTMPEVASVGATEEQLKADGVAYVSGQFPFTANGRARAMNATDGFVKFLADKATDKVLGVHIVGFGAGDMIHEAAVLMEFGGSSEDLGRTCHAHPTLSEAVKEAALATFAKPLHM
ncbi:MAG: dihydrolipoyl dehydrogenase [Pseudomonadota bacterium]